MNRHWRQRMTFQMRLAWTVFCLCLLVLSIFAATLHWNYRVEILRSFELEIQNQLARCLPVLNNIAARGGRSQRAELEELEGALQSRNLAAALYLRHGPLLHSTGNWPVSGDLPPNFQSLPMAEERETRAFRPPPQPGFAGGRAPPPGRSAEGWASEAEDPQRFPPFPGPPVFPPPAEERGQPEVPPRRPPRFDLARVMVWPTETGDWLVCALTDGSTVFLVGGPLRMVEDALHRQLLGFCWMLPLAALPAAAGAAWVARRALRPVKELTAAMAEISAEGLDRRVGQERMDREFRELTEIFNRMLDRLQSSFRQARRFSADAAHELNTPLMIFLGHLETALQEAPDDSEEQRRLGLLLEETERMRDLVDKLLLLSRADNHALVLLRSRFDLAKMAAEILEDVRAVAGHKSIAAQTLPVPIVADPALIRAILYNLLSNAIKYSPDGAAIRVRIFPEDGHAVCLVANTGQPLSIDVEGHLFDRFFRADTARQRTGGLGLGLSLARELARAHGGELRLAENGPEEIVFRLQLPLGDAGLPDSSRQS